MDRADGLAEISLRERDRKSDLLREVESKPPPGEPETFHIISETVFSSAFKSGRLLLNPALLSQQFKANPASCSGWW